MAGEDPKAARATKPERPGAVARDPARGARAEAERGEEVVAEVELDLADVVADANGEVVFFNDSGFRTIGITTGSTVIAEGMIGRRTTAGGADVSGYKYLRFDNGITLYFERGLDLVVLRPAHGA